MSESLSFPIGKFNCPDVIDSQTINAWIKEIAELPKQMKTAVAGLSQEQLNTVYRPGGWTIKQVVNHVPDSHISSYMRFHWALTETNPTIKAYNEKAWADMSYQNNMPISISLDLLEAVHQRWVYLLRSLTKTDLDKTFVHPENNTTYSIKEVVGSYAWHGKHHLAHIVNLKKRKGW